MSTSRTSVVLLILSAACASPERGPAAGTNAHAALPVVAALPDEGRGAAEVDADPRSMDAVDVPAVGSGRTQAAEHLDAAERTLLASPLFRRRFAESLMADTEVEPRSTTAERQHLDQAVEMIGADRLAEAQQKLEEWTGPAASAQFDFLLGMVHARRDEVDRAAECYATALAKHPKFRRAWRQVGMLHFQRGDYAIAATELARVVELGGADALVYGFLGFAHSNLEQNVAAESAYRFATMLDPVTIEWQMGLGRSMFKLQRFGDAVALFDALIQKDPERADLWMLQANAYLGLAQPLKAAECYEMVDRLGKATPDSLNRLGDIYVNEEIYDLAVNAYTRVLAMDPAAKADRALRAARLMAYRRANIETKELLASLDRLRGDTLDTAAKVEMLHLRARIADDEQAGEDRTKLLEEIVRLDPLDGDALIRLGEDCGARGDSERAVFYFERAAGIEKFEADAKVRHAQMLVKQGKYAEALPLLRRAQSVQPRDNIQEYLERIERYLQSR